MSTPILVLLILGGAIAVTAFVAVGRAEKKVASLRARGFYPEAGKEKEEDVLPLLKSGEKIMAIRCYRSLHKVGLKEAKDAVELLEKNA